MASNIPSDEIDKIIKDNSISPDEKTNRINMLIKQYNEPERGRPPYKGDRYSARSKSPFIRSESRDKPHQTQPGIYSPMNSNVQKYSGYVPPQSQYRPRFQQSPQFSSQMQPYMQPQYVQQPMQPQYVQQPMQSQYMQPQYMQQPMQPQYRPKSPYSQQENMSNQFSNLGIQDKYQSPRQSRSDTPSRQYQRSLSRRRSSSRPREAKVESIQKSKDILIKILNLFASNQKLYGIMTQYFSTRINKQPGESGSGGAEVNDIKLILSLLGVLFSGSFVSKYYEYRFNNSASGAALNASRRANNLNLIPGTNVLSYFPLASADAMFIICLFLYKILEDKNYDDKNPPNKTEIENQDQTYQPQHYQSQSSTGADDEDWAKIINEQEQVPGSVNVQQDVYINKITSAIKLNLEKYILNGVILNNLTNKVVEIIIDESNSQKSLTIYNTLYNIMIFIQKTYKDFP